MNTLLDIFAARGSEAKDLFRLVIWAIWAKSLQQMYEDWLYGAYNIKFAYTLHVRVTVVPLILVELRIWIKG